MSTWKIVWNFITGKGTGVVDYLLTTLKTTLNNLGDVTKDKIVAVLNMAMKVLSVAKAVRIFIPVKWQVSYELTIIALNTLITSLQDLELTGTELRAVIEGYNKAYDAWMAPDDETCVTLSEDANGVFGIRNSEAR